MLSIVSRVMYRLLCMFMFVVHASGMVAIALCLVRLVSGFHGPVIVKLGPMAL